MLEVPPAAAALPPRPTGAIIVSPGVNPESQTIAVPPPPPPPPFKPVPPFPPPPTRVAFALVTPDGIVNVPLPVKAEAEV